MKFLFNSIRRAVLSPFFKTSILGILTLILCITACQKETQTEGRQNKIDPKLRTAIERLGLKSEGAFLDNAGNVIAEGDIRLSIAELNLNDASALTTERQRVVGTHCVRSYIETGTTLKYNISNDFDDFWKAAIKSGVAAWENPRNNCAFEEAASPEEADIIFLRNDGLGINFYGIADFPCMSHGREISLNVYEMEADYGATPLFDCIRNVATHEFGHALGFHHTDSDAELLSGTPDDDPTSIMLSGESWPLPPLGLPWFGMLPGPNADDQKMAEYVFPRDGAHITINQVRTPGDPSGGYRIKVKYSHFLAFCYNIEYEIKSGENLLESGSFLSDGFENGSFTSTGFYFPGTYTFVFCGKNYAQDYNAECAMKTSKTFVVPYYTTAPPDIE